MSLQALHYFLVYSSVPGLVAAVGSGIVRSCQEADIQPCDYADESRLA